MSEENQSIKGTIERITFTSDETGYTVIKLMPESPRTLWDSINADGTVTVTGSFPDIIPGESLELEGIWVTHPRHGRQFKAIGFKRIAPTTLKGIEKYLGSGLIKGVGPKTAERIVATFGKDTLLILEKSPERLKRVSGVGEYRINMIREAWEEQKSIRDVMLFLQSHGITTSLAVRIFKEYGQDSIDLVQSHPFRLANDIHGIGFKTADQIARNLGLPENHPDRISAGFVFVLDQASKDGHVFLPLEVLLRKTSELIQIDENTISDVLDEALDTGMIISSSIMLDDNEVEAIYLPPLFHAETSSAHRLSMLLESRNRELFSDDDLSQMLTDAAADETYELTNTQIEAIRSSLSQKISIITGGPGTGKTTIINTVVRLLRKGGYTFKLASPTGRAAKRLSEATGSHAQTIHRLLGYSPRSGWEYDEFHPLKNDVFVIDEASMIDILLGSRLLHGIHPDSRIIFVGDIDQLPSVGPGNFLRDLIYSGRIHTTRLDVIFRQAQDSSIIENAHRINNGKLPRITESANDFFHFKIGDNPARAAELIVDIVKNRLPDGFDYDPMKDIQVLVPMYRGEAGIQNLNITLQAALNPPGRKAEQVLGGRIFRIGDKVLQTSNDYDKDIFNGDIGTIRSINPVDQDVQIDFDGRKVSFDFNEVVKLLHAYAISVHRAQGSEYPVIVMPFITQYYVMLQRNLFYTAITRAKEMVVLVGSQKAMRIAVNTDEVKARYSGLGSRIRDEI